MAVKLTGNSGSSYTFNTYPLSEMSDFKAVSCVYAFLKDDRNPILESEILYIGRTNDASQRLTSSHEKLPCANRNGGRYVAVHQTGTPMADEGDLPSATVGIMLETATEGTRGGIVTARDAGRDEADGRGHFAIRQASNRGDP